MIKVVSVFAVLTVFCAINSVHAQKSVLMPLDTVNRTHPHAKVLNVDARYQTAKLDPALNTVAFAVNQLGASLAAPQLHNQHPALKMMQYQNHTYVAIDAVTQQNSEQFERELTQLGLLHPSHYSNMVGGWMPIDKLHELSALAGLRFARASLSHTRAASGIITTQGDYAQHSYQFRTTYPSITGNGISVGILSSSFNCFATYALHPEIPKSGYQGWAYYGFTNTYNADVSAGVLPAGINVLKDDNCLSYDPTYQTPDSDEGRAMAQIVHAVAPQASLLFYTADISEADFANGIGALAQAGAKIIVDDVGYFDEPFFQDGVVAQAINQVHNSGVTYFSAAGNDGHASNVWEAPNQQAPNLKPSFVSLSSSYDSTQTASNIKWLNFDTTGATTTTALPVTIGQVAPGFAYPIIVEWDDSYVSGYPGSKGAQAQIDLCVSNVLGSDLVSSVDAYPQTTYCTGPVQLGTDPVQIILVGLAATATDFSAPENMNVSVGLVNGTSVPGRIKVQISDDGAGSTINQFANFNATIQGHPSASGAIAVAAIDASQTNACGLLGPMAVEVYSSAGGDPVLFDATGARLSQPKYVQKPDLTAPDKVSNTILGASPSQYNSPLQQSSVTQCQWPLNYPLFQGTSAAAPHAAGIAALMLQNNNALEPEDIRNLLTSTAVAMDNPSPGLISGAGLIQADAAITVNASSGGSSGTAPTSPTNSSTSGSSSGHGGGTIGVLELSLLSGLIWLRRKRSALTANTSV